MPSAALRLEAHISTTVKYGFYIIYQANHLCLYMLQLSVTCNSCNTGMSALPDMSYSRCLRANADISGRDRPIMPIIMLCCSAHKIYLLCSRIRIVLSYLCTKFA